MFSAPILRQENLEKEVSAVNGEYVNDLSKDSWKVYGLTAQLSKPDHPYHTFTVGNRETLMVDGVKDAM